MLLFHDFPQSYGTIPLFLSPGRPCQGIDNLFPSLQLYGEKEPGDSDSEVEREVKEKGETVTLITKRIPKKKRARLDQEEEEEERVMDTGLSLQDDEDLVLRLLSK
jgi:hypothetical protein